MDNQLNKNNDLLTVIAQKTFTLIDLSRRLRLVKNLLEKKIYGSNLEIQISDEDKLWLSNLAISFDNPQEARKYYQSIEGLIKKISNNTPLQVIKSKLVP